jgi:hypothetical protein
VIPLILPLALVFADWLSEAVIRHKKSGDYFDTEFLKYVTWLADRHNLVEDVRYGYKEDFTNVWTACFKEELITKLFEQKFLRKYRALRTRVQAAQPKPPHITRILAKPPKGTHTDSETATTSSSICQRQSECRGRR